VAVLVEKTCIDSPKKNKLSFNSFILLYNIYLPSVTVRVYAVCIWVLTEISIFFSFCLPDLLV